MRAYPKPRHDVTFDDADGPIFQSNAKPTRRVEHRESS